MREARKQDPNPKERAEPTLPLGGGAFASPLAFRPSDTPKPSGAKPVLLVLLAGALAAGSIIGAALLVRDQRTSAAPPSTTPMRDTVLRAEPASSARAKLAPLPRPNAPKPAALATAKSAAKPAVTPVASGAVAAQPRVQAIPVKAEKREAPTRRDRKARAPAPQQPKLPSTLSRDQVIATMTKITPAVNACFGNERGKATVSFAVIGKTGRVVGARVTGKTGKVGSCIARSVRRARFPKFEKPRLEISYPFAR